MNLDSYVSLIRRELKIISMLNSDIYCAKQYLLVSDVQIVKGLQKYTPLNRLDVPFFLKTYYIYIFFHLHQKIITPVISLVKNRKFSG